jgi:hypothetical protein
MRSACLLGILTIVMAVGCHRSAPYVEIADRDSMESCEKLTESDRNPSQEEVAQFFISEVGVDVKSVHVARGSLCAGVILFAISLDDGEFRHPFFVEVEPNSKRMRLLRPH